jgi:ferredoxin
VFVILTSKPGQFRTELSDGLTPVEAWDYVWFGRTKAQFVIARIEGSPRITIIEEEPPQVVNHIPSKFLPKYQTLAAAQQELQHLAHFSGTDAKLEKRSGPAAPQQRASGTLRVTFISNANKVATAPVNSNLLRVSLREQGGIPFKCGGGLCGTCKCRIETGLQNTDEIKPKERKHLSDEEFRQGYRMACQTFLQGDVSVSWSPRPRP